jgi:C4-dicarboxylate-specific signal transduction histidine kinase
VLDSLHEEVAIVDAKGKVIEINRSWRKAVESVEPIGGAPVLAGSNLLEACATEAARGNPDAGNELRALKAVLDGSEIRCQLEQASGPPGAAIWEVTIEKLQRAEGGAVITRADVTSRKRAELEARTQRQQLTHLGRVAILGQLSGAFAHELNQPLTSILGNAEAALRLLEPGPARTEVQEILHDIIDEDLRAAQVIQRLRALLDKGESVREPVNLNSTVHEVLSLCKSELIARNVRVQTDLDPAIPAVMADRVQMQQIILNLLMNACDAMADHPVAERTVALATNICMEPLSVELSIRDSGSGIPPEDLERIFHPFITSKPHGMGLGLAICRSVAESHRGRLWAGNVANGGAVFHLILPAGGALS